MNGPAWAIADLYVAELAAHEPDAAQAIGVPAPLAPDLSPEWHVARYELQGKALTALGAIALPSLEGDERALALALGERLRSERLLYETGFTTRLLAPLATPVHALRQQFDRVVAATDPERTALGARLVAAADALGQWRRTLEFSREQGEAGAFTGTGVAAARQVRSVIGQLRGWLDGGFYQALPAPGPAIDTVTAASHDFLAFLEDELLPTAPTVDAVGETVYAATAQSFLGTAVDLDDTYAYGWSELHRLVDQARRIAARILGETDAAPDVVRRAAACLDSDERYRLHGVPAIESWLTERVDGAIATVSTVLDVPPGIDELDCIVSEASTGVVYYSPGSADGTVRSRVVWTLPGGASSPSTWLEVTSMHHEGVPGHHYEHSVNRANARLHPWQRYLCAVHGYAEGWAHYAEQLADDAGLLRDDAERLGMVLGQIWRSIRIVADIGLHTGRPIPPTPLTDATSWTPELAVRLLEDLALTDPHTARFEVDRYLGWPGQALAFKVGSRLWAQARDRALTSGTTLRDFHRTALGHGPMGLGPLALLLGA